jgi:hypothetical protein
VEFSQGEKAADRASVVIVPVARRATDGLRCLGGRLDLPSGNSRPATLLMRVAVAGLALARGRVRLCRLVMEQVQTLPERGNRKENGQQRPRNDLSDSQAHSHIGAITTSSLAIRPRVIINTACVPVNNLHAIFAIQLHFSVRVATPLLLHRDWWFSKTRP